MPTCARLRRADRYRRREASPDASVGNRRYPADKIGTAPAVLCLEGSFAGTRRGRCPHRPVVNHRCPAGSNRQARAHLGMRPYGDSVRRGRTRRVTNVCPHRPVCTRRLYTDVGRPDPWPPLLHRQDIARGRRSCTEASGDASLRAQSYDAVRPILIRLLSGPGGSARGGAPCAVSNRGTGGKKSESSPRPFLSSLS